MTHVPDSQLVTQPTTNHWVTYPTTNYGPVQ